MSKLHTGVFGPSLYGKSTVLRFISRKNYKMHGVESLILDRWKGDTDWGPQAEVFDQKTEEDLFWKRVWSTQGKIVFVDDGTSVIARSRELIPTLTEIRHNHHKMVIAGHRVKDTLLPVMRDQLSTLFLFCQTKKSVEIWEEDWSVEPSGKGFRQAIGLNPHQFLHCVKTDTGPKFQLRKLTPEEMKL